MEILRYVLDNTNTDNPTVVLGVALVLGLLLLSILSGAVRQTDESTPLELALVYFRRAILVLLIVFVPVFLAALYTLAYWQLGADRGAEYMTVWWGEFRKAFGYLWWSVAVIVIAPVFFKFVVLRNIAPAFSMIKRRFMIRQTGDSLSDIRVEIKRTKAKDFDPTRYYKDGYIFLGLDKKDRPVMIPDDEFLKTHSKILGPTQTGKGVLMGVILDQAIKKGWGAWFIDPKPDKFIYDIMKQAAEESGRQPPEVLDLNGEGPGHYSPFIGGTIRDRRERLVKAFRMSSNGTNADHFKLKERAIIDYLMPFWDGSLPELKRLLKGKHPAITDSKRVWMREEGGDVFEKVDEFMYLPPLLATPENSLNIEKTLGEGRAVYVRSHTKDTLVRAATIALLDEVMQITLKKPLPNPTLLIVDECRFLVTDSLADALATVLGNGLCMGLAYQSILDLVNIPDQTLNGPSIRAGLETNTRLTVAYGSDDIETAEWVAGKTGTIQKTVTRLEKLSRNRGGAEEWDGERSVGSQEESLITANQVLALPARVSVLKRPGTLADLLFTCWVNLKNPTGMPARKDHIETQLDELKKKPAPRTAEPESPTPPPRGEMGDPFDDLDFEDQPVTEDGPAAAGKTFTKLTKEEEDRIAQAATEILSGSPKKGSKEAESTKDNELQPQRQDKKPLDLSSLDDIKGI